MSRNIAIVVPPAVRELYESTHCGTSSVFPLPSSGLVVREPRPRQEEPGARCGAPCRLACGHAGGHHGRQAEEDWPESSWDLLQSSRASGTAGSIVVRRQVRLLAVILPACGEPK